MTRKDMDADLRVSLDALVNKQVERGARDGRNEAIVTIVALLAACVMAAMLCHCGGAPFTAEQLTIRADDGGNTSTDGGPQGDDASSAVDAMGGGGGGVRRRRRRFRSSLGRCQCASRRRCRFGTAYLHAPQWPRPDLDRLDAARDLLRSRGDERLHGIHERREPMRGHVLRRDR